jgi:hypothetical protein
MESAGFDMQSKDTLVENRSPAVIDAATIGYYTAQLKLIAEQLKINNGDAALLQQQKAVNKILTDLNKYLSMAQLIWASDTTEAATLRLKFTDQLDPIGKLAQMIKRADQESEFQAIFNSKAVTDGGAESINDMLNKANTSLLSFRK